MAEPRAWNAARVRGKLLVGITENPSTGTYPYGGTPVGEAIGCALVSLSEPYMVRSESIGGPRAKLEAENYWQFRCGLRGLDDDARELLLAANAVPGFTTRHVGFDVPGNRAPGQVANERAVRMLLVPRNAVRHDALMIYCGVPDLAPDAELALRQDEDLVFPLVVDLFEDARENAYRLARLADITLNP